MSSEVPFKTIVMRFNDGLNDFDVGGMIQFCNKNQIPCEIFDLNVLDFF